MHDINEFTLFFNVSGATTMMALQLFSLKHYVTLYRGPRSLWPVEGVCNPLDLDEVCNWSIMGVSIAQSVNTITL